MADKKTLVNVKIDRAAREKRYAEAATAVRVKAP